MKKMTTALLFCALLFAACTPSAPDTPAAATAAPAVPTVAEATVPPAQPLPRALYFLAPDANNFAQVFRLERDAVTRVQLTFEPAPVEYYNVSPLDGALAYVTNNQLYLTDAAGGGRRLLVDGGPKEQTADFFSFRRVSDPVWSPDGKKLAYGYNGVNLHDFATDATALLLQNTTQSPDGNPFFRWRYMPLSFSPDGTRLLVEVGWPEGGMLGVIQLSSGRFVELQESTPTNDATWAPDGSAILVASQSMCYMQPGLWRYDPAGGAQTVLIAEQGADGKYNFAASPFLAPDGQLYFFYGAYEQYTECGGGPLTMVRAGVDGVIGRTAIYPPAMQVIEALWFPDASGAVVLRVLATDPAKTETVLVNLTAQTEQALNQPIGMGDLQWGR